MDLDDTFVLGDGRELGYATWGPPDAQTAFQFHGSPAGRLDRWGDDSVLDDLAVRLVTVDRPGIGRSARQANRRVVDWADDVRQLADHLRAESFAVIGFSLGGPYAAACAARLRDRVTAVALVSAVGRIDEQGFERMGVAPYHRLAQRAPVAMRGIYASLGVMARVSTPRAHKMLWGRAPRVDREIVDRPDVRERYWPALMDALRGGARGLVDDMRTAQRPWGFDAAEVTAPVHLFHGSADRVVPPDDARYWVDALPDCHPRWYEGEGHFLIEDRFEEIVGAVLPVSHQ